MSGGLRPKRASADPVIEMCLAEGFAAAAICHAGGSERERELREWLGLGRHASMDWIAESAHARVDVSCLVANARSIICVADRYHDGTPDPPNEGAPLGRIARYARGRDYHRGMKRRLRRICRNLHREHPGQEFRPCCDIEPIMEREYAARSGLARIGKNTLAIVEGLGSWVMLGEIVTTLEIEESSRPADPDPCGTCTRCIDACPTGAINGGSVDSRICFSYLTLEHDGPVQSSLHQGTGDWLLGCDACQEVCPHNQPTVRSRSRRPHPDFDGRISALSLMEVAGWDAAARAAAFAQTTLKRVPLERVRRSAMICLGEELRRNPSNRLVRERLTTVAADPVENPAVRAAAVDALRAEAGPSPKS